MSVLTPISQREALNIDTIERAVGYSAILLRKAVTSPLNPIPPAENPYYNAVRLNVDTSANIGKLLIEAKLPYNSQLALEDGANFLQNIDVFGTTDPNPISSALTPTTDGFLPLPVEPSYVNTLERYFAWASHLLLSGLLILAIPDSRSVVINVLEEAKPTSSIQIKVYLSIYSSKYLTGSSILDSIARMVTRIPTADSNIIESSSLNVYIGGTSQQLVIFDVISDASTLNGVVGGTSTSLIDNSGIYTDIIQFGTAGLLLQGTSVHEYDNIQDIINSSIGVLELDGSSIHEPPPADVIQTGVMTITLGGTSTSTYP